MKRPLRIVIDGPNVAHGLRHAIKLNANDGRPTGVAMGWLRTISRLNETFRPDEIVVAWETEERSWRYRRYPEYKEARRTRYKKQTELEQQELNEFFNIQMPDTITMLHNLGILQIAVPGLEADDILGLCAAKQKKDSARVIIVSTDKDMLQLARYNHVRIYNAYADTIYHQKKTGHLAVNGRKNRILAPSPDTYLLWRTIIGDQSDSLPGIPGVGEKTVEHLYGYLPFKTREWTPKDIKKYLSSVELNGKRGQAILDGTKRILRNIELMRLAPDVIPHELLSGSARAFVKCFQKNCTLRYTTPIAQKKYPLFLRYTKRDPNPMLVFFRKRDFDFAFNPLYWNKMVTQFQLLFNKTTRFRENADKWNARLMPTGFKKYNWEITQ